MDDNKRYKRGDAIYFAPAINFKTIDENCAFEYVKTIRFENDRATVEYTDIELHAFRLPIPLSVDGMRKGRLVISKKPK
jgi:hypothetical protein